MGQVTLLDRLGGEDGVRSTVSDLYGRLLDDDAVARYFEDVDLPRLRVHMTDFLTAALTGAPSGYSGRALDVAHRGLGVTPAAFDSVVVHLGDALAAGGVDEQSVGAVVELLAPLRPLVVDASPADSMPRRSGGI